MTETHEAADTLAEEARSDNDNEDIGRCLLELLPSTPESYRAAVELAEVEGLTPKQVGERLGLSISGAKSRVQRARRMLREILLDCCEVVPSTTL